MSLEGKVAFVSGASRPRGIGRAIALTLAKNRADVAVSGFSHMEGAMTVANEIRQENLLPYRWMSAIITVPRPGLPKLSRN
jgi:NAD(P)-dependent dehydrogenase (short-subunit alcohol dehydrogenase family)